MSYRWPWVVQPGCLRTTGRELRGRNTTSPLGSHVSIDYSRQLRYKEKKKKGNSHSNSPRGKESGGGF